MSKKKKKKNSVKELLKYFGIFSVALIYWEIIMMIRLGGFKLSSLFLLFFLPALAMGFSALCGFCNRKISRVSLPIIMLVPFVFYLAQNIYLSNFGSLFSISMAGMGGDALGNFGWAVTDSIVASIGWILALLLPLLVTIFLSVINPIKLNSYKLPLHFVALLLCIILWFAGVLGIRCFGDDRTSPYYLYTSSSATTDSAARKLGVLTTLIVEGKSYYFGSDTSDENEFVFEDEDTEAEEPPLVKPVMSFASDKKDDDIGLEAEVEPEVVYSPWIDERVDFSKLIDSEQSEDIANLSKFFSKRQPSMTNEMTGKFEGYNLIYICAEGFWSYACNEEVTPTLYKMAHNGIVLNNYYNSFYNTTTNGEFAFASSLWPDVSRHSSAGTDVGSFAQSASKYMPQGLGDLFTAAGIKSLAFHNYYGKYYRRILSWPNMGYDCKFTGDGMYFTSNWPASDLELMEQSVDDYIDEPQFHAYYMTFSGHGPYTAKNYMYNKNIGDVNAIVGTEKYNDEARGYLAGQLELDRAMEYLLNRLEEKGILDKTVIVIAGDHFPYYLSDEGLYSLVGNEIDKTFDIYKSNCIIYNAGMTEPLEVADYCSNVDIAPTMLNLFNIPYDSRLMMGRDIFSEQAHKRGVLYNKSFIDEKVAYDYENAEAKWTAKGNELSADAKDKYIEKALNEIENEYTAACKVIEDNYYLKLYEACGILSADEVTEELSREENVRNRDEAYNADDAAKEEQRKAEEAAAAAAVPVAPGDAGAAPAMEMTVPAQ